MKIIITGALGHIGSYLIRDLYKSFPKYEILMIDNLMTQRYSSLFNLPSIGKFRFIEGDINQMDLFDIFKDANVVIHLAAITDAASSFENAKALENNNYNSTKRIAEVCLSTKTNMIMLSSTSVYGTQSKIIDEECSLSELAPQSPYAETKLKEELFIQKLNKDYGLNCIILRLGTIYGASIGMRFHTAVNKFCWQAINNQPITVWTTAFDQKRPYLDLIDASRFISLIIKNNIFDGKIYNVLTQNSTVREVVDVIKLFKNNITINFVDNKIMNQLSYEVSVEKSKRLGFEYSGNLTRGITETFEFLTKTN